MNDPLYNHPAWKNKSHDHHDVSTVDHVISEIVKTDYSGELLGGTVSLSSSNESTSTPTKLDPPQMYEIVEDTIPALSKSLQDNIEDETSTAVAHIDISPNKGPSSDSLANGVQTAHCVSEDTCSNTVRTHSHSNSDVEKGQRGNVDPDCTECQLVRADPTPSQLVMYLHALSYEVRVCDWWAKVLSSFKNCSCFYFREKGGHLVRLCHHGLIHNGEMTSES